MNIGSAFQIGRGHTICEDYAITGKNRSGNPIVVLSDGCSTGENTDIGARICCLIQKQGGLLDHDVWNRMIKVKDNLGLSFRSLLATIVSLELLYTSIHFTIVGDGFLYIKKEGKEEIFEFYYEDNTPHYLVYSLFPKEFGLESIQDTRRKIRKWTKKDGVWIQEENSQPFDYFIKLKGLEKIFIFSDGVSSFKKDNEKISATSIIEQIVNFPSFQGEAAIRQLRILNRSWADTNFRHYDDLSFGYMNLS